MKTYRPGSHTSVNLRKAEPKSKSEGKKTNKPNAWVCRRIQRNEGQIVGYMMGIEKFNSLSEGSDREVILLKVT